jgi:hypothetical protein
MALGRSGGVGVGGGGGRGGVGGGGRGSTAVSAAGLAEATRRRYSVWLQHVQHGPESLSAAAAGSSAYPSRLGSALHSRAHSRAGSRIASRSGSLEAGTGAAAAAAAAHTLETAVRAVWKGAAEAAKAGAVLEKLQLVNVRSAAALIAQIKARREGACKLNRDLKDKGKRTFKKKTLRRLLVAAQRAEDTGAAQQQQQQQQQQQPALSQAAWDSIFPTPDEQRLSGGGHGADGDWPPPQAALPFLCRDLAKPRALTLTGCRDKLELYSSYQPACEAAAARAGGGRAAELAASPPPAQQQREQEQQQEQQEEQTEPGLRVLLEGQGEREVLSNVVASQQAQDVQRRLLWTSAPAVAATSPDRLETVAFACFEHFPGSRVYDGLFELAADPRRPGQLRNVVETQALRERARGGGGGGGGGGHSAAVGGARPDAPLALRDILLRELPAVGSPAWPPTAALLKLARQLPFALAPPPAETRHSAYEGGRLPDEVARFAVTLRELKKKKKVRCALCVVRRAIAPPPPPPPGGGGWGGGGGGPGPGGGGRGMGAAAAAARQ